MCANGPGSRKPSWSEDEVLLACSQRFDGKAYLRESGYDPQPLLDAYVASGDWPEDAEPLHLLAAYHVLQRRLMAWGTRPTPRDDRAWFVFRSLFLHLVQVPVPARYRNPSGWVRWQERYASHLRDAEAAVREIHERTAYRDDALHRD